MDKLCAAMAKAFPEIEGATKDKTNPAFKSRYADLASVVEAIKPALIKNGLFFVQKTFDATGGVCVETEVWHSSGEHMGFGPLFVPAAKQDAQGFGSALTYCRRYSLMTAFGVAPEDDDGNAAVKAGPVREIGCSTAGPKRPPEKLSGPHMTVAALKAALGDMREEVTGACDYSSLDAYLIDVRETIDQVKRDKPDWWSHPDYGMDGIIKAAYERIEREQPVSNVIDYTRAG